MLLITSEELATPRDNVSSARKEELRRLLNTQVSIVSVQGAEPYIFPTKMNTCIYVHNIH